MWRRQWFQSQKHVSDILQTHTNTTLFVFSSFCSSLLQCLWDADVAGGIDVLEFTMTCPNRFEHIKDYARRGFLVGLGTCLELEDARRGAAAGASFIVSPVFDPVVVQETLRLDRVCIPGCNTPSEMCTQQL